MGLRRRQLMRIWTRRVRMGKRRRRSDSDVKRKRRRKGGQKDSGGFET
jgi:hypothetical protein